MSTVRLTTGQALVRWMVAQRTVIDGAEAPLFPGVFAIFGHGNVTCLGTALDEVREELPTWRGQNEQGMALAAIGYAKAMRGRQIMVATSSIGPGALNMVTAAGVAHSNRLPVLLLSGDTFASRAPDPVLQQVEHFGDPTVTVNDAFRPVVRYWDRITRPAQLISSLPQALRTMLDPATRGPAFLALPQDVQAEAFDFPAAMFDTVVHEIPRPRADRRQLERAAALIASAERPLIIAGGGVHYSQAEAAVTAFAERHGIPVTETVSGKASLVADHPLNAGPVGVTGGTAANALAAEADVVIAIGSRLGDFATGSWSAFDPAAAFVSINTTAFDAVKHRSAPVVGDARETVTELDALLGDWSAPAAWASRCSAERATYFTYLDGIAAPAAPGELMTYAQVVGAVDRISTASDYALTAAGGFPGELVNGWRAKGLDSFDCEYGFSCMGYETSGGWGAAMARAVTHPDGDVFVFVGDGSYLMMNSDLYSSVLSGHKLIVLVCDNGGFAVINRLQTNQGGRPFNNLLADTRHVELIHVDFAAHAAAMGCDAINATTPEQLEAALGTARASNRTTVISIPVSAYDWTEGGTWWEVGVPEVSDRPEITTARAALEAGKANQRLL